MTQDQFDKFCTVLGTTLELDIVKKFMQYLPEDSVDDIESCCNGGNY